jgi:nucleoside-triphosphatase THEP1
MMQTSPHLYLITAPRGAGKTTFCRVLADQARAAGWDVAGLLSLPIFENGVKTGILAENLRTGETRHLAQLSTLNVKRSTFNLPFGQWLFSSSTLDWGNEIFAASLPCDLFIVDELGPLELIRGEGWVNAFDALRQVSYRLGVVVIRPECVDDFSKLGFSFQVRKLLDPQTSSLLTPYLIK